MQDWAHDFEEYMTELCRKKWKLISNDIYYEFSCDIPLSKMSRNTAKGTVSITDNRMFAFNAILLDNDINPYISFFNFPYLKGNEAVAIYKVKDMYPVFISPPGRLILENTKTGEELCFENIL